MSPSDCDVTHPQIRRGPCPWCEETIIEGSPGPQPELDDFGEVDFTLDDLPSTDWDYPRMIADLGDKSPRVREVTLNNLWWQDRDFSIGDLAPDDPADAIREGINDWHRFILRAQTVEPNSATWPGMLGMTYRFISLCKARFHQDSSRKWLMESTAQIEHAVELDATDSDHIFLSSMLCRLYMDADLNDKARSIAEDLLSRMLFIGECSGSAHAINKAHTILGRIDLSAGDIESAKSHLLASIDIDTPPIEFDWRLANDLLYEGEREVVLRYLERCSALKPDTDCPIKHWCDVINQGGYPDFPTFPYV
ncbi:tetratricopeptide repeat protein [Singulisphaera sp. PoT]|uniref:tetratricopeptide repeat protein n=1 Tax=Singulisphaera sp. PoT TaxID=3411797 RepID=UPI003BF51E8E